MKIGAIIQARTSSSRLPRKVLKKLPYNSDDTVLKQVIKRVSRSDLIDDIIIATSSNDPEIVDIAVEEGVKYYQGSLNNVLKRYYEAACENDLDIIVRITSDCPCIDFEIIDSVIESHIDLSADYTSNSLKNSFPRGFDVEVINFDVLEKTYFSSTEDYEKEHVTPFIYKSHQDDFKINAYCGNEDNSDIRLTLDTSEDYTLLCLVYDYLYDRNNFFNLNDILELFSKKPWIKYINQNTVQKKVCSNLTEELEETIRLCEIQDLNKAKKFIEDLI